MNYLKYLNIFGHEYQCHAIPYACDDPLFLIIIMFLGRKYTVPKNAHISL